MSHTSIHKLKVKYILDLPIAKNEELRVMKYFNRINFFNDREVRNKIKYKTRQNEKPNPILSRNFHALEL